MEKKTKIIIVLCILLIVTAVGYKFIIERNNNSQEFENQLVKQAEKNEIPVFYIKKVMLYSSAGVVDNSQNKDLSNVNISQYTDIGIYLKNNNEESITAENTINRLWIDEINLETPENWENKHIEYKNPYKFGKFEEHEYANNSRIEYNVIQKNEENKKEIYDNPTFYTDCSNPITLGYVNSNIITGAKVRENSSIALDGKILSQAQVNLEKLNYNLSFMINIENNLGQLFKYKMKLNVYLNAGNNELYNGYLLQEKEVTGREFGFFRTK